MFDRNLEVISIDSVGHVFIDPETGKPGELAASYTQRVMTSRRLFLEFAKRSLSPSFSE